MKQHLLSLSKEKKFILPPLYPQCFDIHLNSQYQGPSALYWKLIKFYYIGLHSRHLLFLPAQHQFPPFLWRTPLLYRQCMALGGADPPLSSRGPHMANQHIPFPGHCAWYRKVLWNSVPGLLLAFWGKRRSFFTWINSCSNNGSWGGLKFLVEKAHLRMLSTERKVGQKERARTRNKTGNRGKRGEKKKRERKLLI